LLCGSGCSSALEFFDREFWHEGIPMTKLQTFRLLPFGTDMGWERVRDGQAGLWKTICLALVFCAAAVVASSAQTLTTLVSFNDTDGDVPYFASLVQGANGNFYGTTQAGGLSAAGNVFEITAVGKLTVLHSFSCSKKKCRDGALPNGVIQATNGNFYGTNQSAGANSVGTVFKITPEGTVTTLHTFCSQTGCTDGESPVAGLVQATNGNFYGTTTGGGANNAGTVFEITAAGKLTTLYSFCSQTGCTDGDAPSAGLVQATNGNFYGTTYEGGASNAGTVFEITAAGKLTTLYSFCSQTSCTDGEEPVAGLVQATNGKFYGTTPEGGANNAGTVFEITAAGKLTTLYSFCSQTGCTDGKATAPLAGLVQATNGNFYGTTLEGGANNVGTVFEITATGKLTTLYSFCSQTNCTDGEAPETGLVQATNGTFYGTTGAGGAIGDGTVFSLSVGLGPFVETQPTSGKVGAEVIILGTNLTGTTSVSFNGTAATFTVVSSTEITTTVPTGATTGTVEVTTPGGTLNSNVKFRVTP
jgi:uncharacterized repeat protein (TIGR03803 family)